MSLQGLFVFCDVSAIAWDLPGLPRQVIEFSLIFFHYKRNLAGSVKSDSRPGREPLGGGVSVVLTSRAGLGGRPEISGPALLSSLSPQDSEC